MLRRCPRGAVRGTKPTSGCRSRGGFTLLRGRRGLGLFLGARMISIGGGKGGVISIVKGGVVSKGRCVFGTRLFSSYAKSKRINFLTKTSCHVKERDGRRANRPETPLASSLLIVKASIR